MMLDGKCRCGWCGNQDHTTGDTCCPALAASRKKQEDKQKKAHAKRTKKVELPDKRQSVVRPVRFTNSENEEATPVHPVPPSPSAPRRLRTPSIKLVAQSMVTPDPTVSNQSGGNEAPIPPTSRSNTPRTMAAHRKQAISDFPRLLKASNSLYAKYESAQDNQDDHALPVIKVEEVRKGAFTDGLADEYKHQLVRKVKRLSSMEQYIGARAKILGDMTTPHDGEDDHDKCRLPRKPKIPKPSRRLVNPKTKQARPDRFNRKINRMMRKIWRKDHPLPVVEESLRDL